MPNRQERGKGSTRIIRSNKAREATERNDKTAPDKRRAYWRERGFSRQSEAARIVRETVAEGNKIAQDVRARSGQDDWTPDYDLATADRLREILSGSESR